MIKSIHAIAISLLALVLTPGNECQAQIVGGFYPNWYGSSSMNNLQWTKMTDLFYAFAEPTSTGGYTLNNESWLTTLVTKGKANNVRIHLSFGGATQGSTGWATCISTATNRTNFATTCKNLVTTYDLNGINLDWEFPEGSEAVNYADLAVKVRAALDQAEITLGHKVYLTCAVAPLIWNNDGINSTFLGVMDYVMPMAFDDGNCSYCGGPNASSLTMAQNAFLHWTTGIPGSGVAGKGVAANKLVIAIPFYENGGTAYNSFSTPSPASYYNDADGYYGGYYYNSDPLIKAKTDYLMPKAVAGLWTWELVHDRTDEYSLLGSMYSNVMSYSCVFATPTLGTNQSICGQASITLHSGIATATGRTFTWKKDGAIVLNASTSATTYTITSAGTYRVEVTQESCTKFDEVVISGTMPAVNLGGPYHLCNPITVTLNSGSDVTGKTFVWEKDNVVIAGATSTAYTASLAGTYNVTVNATGCASVSGTATVSSSLPVPKNDTLCAAGTANLTSSIAADWFTAASGGTSINTNSTSYAPSISTNTTYYIQPYGASATSYTTMRTAFQNNGWQQNANVYATKFDALTSLTLDAVTVNVGGGDVKINIVAIDGVTLVASKTFTALSAGINTLSLGFSLSAGTYYINTVGTVSTALVDVTPASNYSIANVLTVYGEAYWDWTVPYGDGYVLSGDYGFFSNLKVTVGNTCGRTPIDAVIDPSNAKCTSNPLVANFTANKTTACTGEQIIFTDTSGGPATSWSWNFGANATPATATGKGPITVTYSETGTKTVALTSTNTYGFNTNTKTNYLTITGTAGTAGAITGNTTVCSGDIQDYSLAAVSGADTYTWTVPTGASIVSGQGTISITVNYTGASAGNLTVTPSNGCGNGTATTMAITVNPLPHAAGAITGNTTVCTGVSQTYSVDAVDGANTYTWTIPSGATISSGQGTNTISVNFSTAMVGNISVTPSNTCGNGTTAFLNVSVTTVPTGTGIVSGLSNVCQNEQNVAFALTGITGASNYAWSVPAGIGIASGNGTPSVLVNFTTSTGNISVVPSNTCGSMAAITKAVAITSGAGDAGVIIGATTVCANKTGVTYAIASVTGAAGYSWTVPIGASIASGTNTNSITVNFGTAAGDITVTPASTCGNGLPATTTIAITTIPAAAGVITGNSPVCSGTNNTYSITTVSGATSYAWTIPSGANITTGAGTNAVVVTFGTAEDSITVTPSNTCGNSAGAALPIVVNTIPANTGIITGVTTICQNQSTTYTVASIPNASAYTWTVPVGAAITTGAGTNTIVVLMGTTSGNVTVMASNNCGNALVASSLTVNVTNGAANAGSISGLSTVCANESNVTYSLVSVNGATGYTWILPTGATIASGNNTNAITVNFAATSGNVNVVPTSACGNGLGTTLGITVNAIPVIADVIAGNAAVCEGSTQNYNIPTVANATTYSWTVPTGATILTGATSNTMSVDFTGSLSGQLSVKAFHGTCVSNTVEAIITVNGALPQPGVFTQSTTAVCSNTNNVAYAVPIVSGAVSYQWTYTGTGVTFSGTTNAITANFAANATSGDVQVIAIGTCGNSISQSVSVAVGAGGLAVLDNIAGNTTVCQHQTGLMYSINTVNSASGYTWTVPVGANITSGNNTNSITLTAGATSGNITVTPFNNCATGNTKTLVLTINAVPEASGSITGNTTVCANQLGELYSIIPVNGATSYTWSTPVGTSIISENDSMVVAVNWGDTSGNITVTPNNACGNGTSSSLGITVNPLPNPAGVISGTTSVCAYQTAQSYSIASVSNASTYSWTIPEGASITAGDNTNTITVNMGDASGNIAVTAVNTCGNGTASAVAVTVNPLLTHTSAITGPVSVCANQTSASYAISPIAGANYVWTIPTGASMTAGSTSNAITLTFGTTSGDVTVTPNNTCGTGQKSVLTVAVTPAITPSVSVTTPYMPVCANGHTSFTAIPVNGGSTPTYAWEINNIPQNGNNTAIFSGIVKTGDVVNVTLTSNVACASTATALGSLNITAIAAAPSKPSGFTSQMATVTEGLTGIAYAINPVANTNVYAWTYDGTGVSFNNTNSVSTHVDFDINATSGNMNVTAINACGTSPMLSLPVTVNPLITLLHKTENMEAMYYQNGFLHVVNAAHSLVQFDIFAMNGVSVLHGNQVNALIDVSELPTAIYVARLKMNDHYYTLKFQK